MTFDDRLADILARMREAKLDAVVALHDGAHFIEKPNPVTVITGFKSLGPGGGGAAQRRRDDADRHAGLGRGARRRSNVRRRAWSARMMLPTHWPLR